jgi:hypothetical protein
MLGLTPENGYALAAIEPNENEIISDYLARINSKLRITYIQSFTSYRTVKIAIKEKS